MLARLLRLFRPPRRDPRQIYTFWDGERTRRVDPVAVWSRLEEVAGEDWPELLKVMTTKLPPAPAGVDTATTAKALAESKRTAANKISDAVCSAFGVEPFVEDHGLTTSERISLAADFLSYMGGLAAAARHPTTSRPPTA